MTVDLFRGETRTPEHFARNPDGRVPVLETRRRADDPESGAILLYLAEGTPLLPADRPARARVHQWMFFEQNQIEADRRDGAVPEARGPRPHDAGGVRRQVARGRAALATLDRGLADGRPFLAGDATRSPTSRSTATATAAPTRAPTRASTPTSARWLDRVEATPGFVNDLAPFPAHVTERPI